MSKLRLSLCAVLFLSVCFFSSAAFSSDVEFFSPTGEVKKVRQVAVRFAEQMVALGDPREVAPFDIACPAPGRGRWADQRNWVYDFDRDLPAGMTCTFTLKKGLVTVRGRHIEGGAQFSFNTGGPAIIRSEPSAYVPIDENQVFILGLDAPASADSIKEHAACLVDGVPEQIPVRLITGDQRRKILDVRSSFLTSYYFAILKSRSGGARSVVLGVEERGSDREKFLKLRDAPNSPIVVLQCQRTLPSNTRVTLLWDQGIRSLSGLPTRAPQNLPFTTREAFQARFSCYRVNADAGCIPALPMNLQFSAPIKVSDAEKIRLVSRKSKPVYAIITPENRKNGFLDSVSFPVPLPEQAEFKLELPAHLKDDADRTLSNAASFPLSVHTDENPPLAKFAARFGIVELNASKSVPPLLPVTLRNVEPVLDGNIAGTVEKGHGGGAIAGKVMRGASEGEVVSWLRRLESVDREAYNEPERGPGKHSVFDRSDNLIPIKVPKKLGGKAFEVVGIPLNGPGFYVVELASPRLGEALFDQQRPYYVHAAALVTNLSVHFKKGRESSLVWVTSLDKGEAVRDADVAVRDCSGKTYFQGRTDAEGVLRIGQQLPGTNSLAPCVGYDRQYFVTARKGNDFSFVFSDWNEGISLWRFNAFPGQYQSHSVAHAVMDRTLVRAGETVHMKLFLRRQTGAGFAPVDFTPPQKIQVEHLGSEEKYELPVSWDSQGIATADWQVPKDAKQGTYAVEVMVARGIDNAGEFRVEAFRVPTMKAVLQAPSEPLVNAEQATIGIQVNYLSGGGASNLPVKLRGQVLPQTVSFPDYEDYTFANGGLTPGPERVGSEPWYMGNYELADGGGEDEEEEAAPQAAAPKAAGELLPVQNLRLDMAGSAQATFSKLRPSSAPRVIQAEIEYSDPNGEILNAGTRVPLWPSRLVVGIKPEGWIATADHLKFHALVLDLKGKPVPGVEVTVDALQREYFSHRRRLLGGFYAFENRSEIKALGQLCHGTTDSKGLLICEVKAPGSGNIILQAKAQDAQGNASLANRELWVAGSGDWWFDAADSDRIDLLPEKKRYEPGETARLQLRMPFKEATVLVTAEREGVMQSFVTHVSRDNAVIEVPIQGNYAPNVFISALAVRGRVDDVKPTALVDLGKPSFKMGLAEINVGWGAHELKVKVATDRQTYKVREKANVSIDVRRPDGSPPPPGSEVALAAVDEGLLELKPNQSWALLDAMMRRRGIEVSTSTAQMQVIGKRHFGRKALAPGGGGGVGGRRSVRELFDTLLFWKARVKLDAQGHAEAQVPLNDSLTSFRIVAVANGGVDLFGTGSSSIASSQDLMLLSGLPPVVREQDRYRANFTVRNASDHPMEAVVSARADDGRGRQGEHVLAPVSVTLQQGESREVGWTVEVPIGSEALKWDITVREKGKTEDGDHLRVSQRVIPAVAVRTFQATLMQMEKPERIQVKIPHDAIPGRGGLKVSFRKRLGDGLGGVQEYMSRYPYVCFEQIASKAVALQDEGAWDAHMRNVYSYLDGDGLLKYFTIMDQGDDTLTAYILSIADEAGYAIPDAARERMVRGLTGFVEGRVIRYSALPTADLSIRKIAAIAALSRTEKVNPKWLDSIAIEPNLWPTSAVLDWLYILKRGDELPNRDGQLEAAQQIIRSRLNFQGTTMGFSTERSDALWWLMIDGDVNANRALLEFLDMDGWQPDIARLVRGALGRQQRGHWSTTVANAWGVLAMKKFSAKFESVPVTGSTTAAIGRDKVTADWGQAAEGQQGMLPWPRAAADLDLKHQGDGKPWVTVQSLAALPLKKPLFTGYRVVRKIIPIEQKQPGKWHKGDVMRIHLEINAQSDMSWVVVNDPIPAGASVLGTGLGGDSHILTQGEQKRGWVWPAFEERAFDSFRSYYRFVPKGTVTVEYTVRLNNDGDFNLPPTRVEAMYAPEMFGELPNAKVTVLP